jgi:hypothetical protein
MFLASCQTRGENGLSAPLQRPRELFRATTEARWLTKWLTNQETRGSNSDTICLNTQWNQALQGGASGVCETRGSHRAVAGGLGIGLAGESATQSTTKVVAGGFPSATGCRRAVELIILFCSGFIMCFTVSLKSN